MIRISNSAKPPAPRRFSKIGIRSGRRAPRLRPAGWCWLLSACSLGHRLLATDVLPDIPVGTLQIKLTVVATNLHDISDGTLQVNPTGSVGDGSGRLFITTLGGMIRVVEPTGT